MSGNASKKVCDFGIIRDWLSELGSLEVTATASPRQGDEVAKFGVWLLSKLS